MRRLLLFGLLAALLVPASARAASITTRVVQDCADDSVLEGHYTVSELREALRHLPTDVAEYSDCTDVLARAIDAAATAPRTPSGAGGGAGQPPQAAASAGTSAPVGPSTPQDSLAIADAARKGPPPAHVGGRPVHPALAASLTRNRLPASLLTALILVGAAFVAMAAPTLRRVLARRRS